MKTFLVAMTFVLLPAVELSADAARLNTLGLSPDGKVLAYEQHGVLDGSGFSYAKRSYISTITGAHLAGSPVEVLDESYANDSNAARTRARIESLSKIGMPDYQFSNASRKVLAKRIITEIAVEPYKVQFHSHVGELLLGQTPNEIHLEPVLYPAEEECEYVQFEAPRFRIVLKKSGENPTALRFNDKKILRGKGCVLDYQISELARYEGIGNDEVHTIIVSVKSAGFEGPNFRWMPLVYSFE